MTAALLLALAGLLGLVWWRLGETTTAAIATVAAVWVAVAAPLIPWVLGQIQSPAAISDARLEDLMARLASTIRCQWELEADVRQLRDPQPLTVTWTPSPPALMDWPNVISPAQLSLTGSIHEVVEKFEALPRRRLAVIGQPGAGKTALLLLLTLGLLERRAPTGPIPVIVTPASWDPRVERFSGWLATHLSDQYPFLRRAEAEALIERRRVVPVLDGLDELPADRPAVALQAINAAGVQQPLVIACRTAEFSKAVGDGDVLTGAAVVELDSIRPEQIRDYLRLSSPRDDRLARWEPVFAQLHRSATGPVAEALSTPLMVTLARTVYALDRSADPGELVDASRFPDRQAIEDHLLDSWIPAAFAAREASRGSRRWSPEQARRWLAFLAMHLHRSRTRDLAWWELSRTLGPRGRALAVLRVAGHRLPTGARRLVPLLVAGPVALAIGGAEGFIVGPLTGLVAALVAALTYRLTTGRVGTISAACAAAAAGGLGWPVLLFSSTWLLSGAPPATDVGVVLVFGLVALAGATAAVLGGFVATGSRAATVGLAAGIPMGIVFERVTSDIGFAAAYGLVVASVAAGWYRVVVGRTGALWGGLTAGLAGAVLLLLVDGLADGLVLLLVFGPAAAVPATLVGGGLPPRRAVAGLAAGLAVGVPVTVVAGVEVGSPAGAAAAVVAALLTDGYASPLQRPALAVGLAAGLAAGAATGAFQALASVFVNDPGVVLEVATVHGLPFGLGTGVVAGLLHRLTARPLRGRVASPLAGSVAGVLGALSVSLAAVFASRVVLNDRAFVVEFLLLGLEAALAAGLAGGLVLGKVQPARVVVVVDRALMGTLRDAAAVGLLVGLATGLLVGIGEGPVLGLVRGLAFGLAGGAAFGLAFGLTRASDRALTPESTLRSDRAATVLVVLAVGLVIGLGTGIATWLFGVIGRGGDIRTTLVIAVPIRARGRGVDGRVPAMAPVPGGAGAAGGPRTPAVAPDDLPAGRLCMRAPAPDGRRLPVPPRPPAGPVGWPRHGGRDGTA
jgi:hypothetical protein